MFGFFSACTGGNTALFPFLAFFTFPAFPSMKSRSSLNASEQWVNGSLKDESSLFLNFTKKLHDSNSHFSILHFYSCCSKHYHLHSFIPKYCLPELSVFWVIVNIQSKFKVHWSVVNFSSKTDYKGKSCVNSERIVSIFVECFCLIKSLISKITWIFKINASNTFFLFSVPEVTALENNKLKSSTVCIL